MNKRRWWAIGLAIALLVPTLGCGYLSPSNNRTSNPDTPMQTGAATANPARAEFQAALVKGDWPAEGIVDIGGYLTATVADKVTSKTTCTIGFWATPNGYVVHSIGATTVVGWTKLNPNPFLVENIPRKKFDAALKKALCRKQITC